jgi:predicted component of type VI protein secretion system
MEEDRIRSMERRIMDTHRVFASLTERPKAPSLVLGAGPEGQYLGSETRLLEDGLVVGRGVQAKWSFPAFGNMSSRHFETRSVGGGFWTVRDLDSTNGLWINGRRLGRGEERMLSHGDRLGAGGIEFLYHDGEPLPGEHGESSD